MKTYNYACLENLKETFERTNFLVHEVMIKNFNHMSKRGKTIYPIYDVDKKNELCEELVKNLRFLYFDKGMGFKLLCKEIKCLTYSSIRRLFRELDIECRKGTSCVTENLRTIRSERAKIECPWKDWAGNEKYKEGNKNSKRYCGGWYFNKSKNKYVWLRSSWEYGYAKWLDLNNAEWDVEVRSYLLTTGSYYRPDFFIYENNCLKKIVEIKSTWFNGSQDRVDKFYLFRIEYPEVESVLVLGNLFKIIQENQFSLLKEWKKVRRMEKINVN